MTLFDAHLHCEACPGDLGAFVLALLVKSRQQHDAPIGGKEERDPTRTVPQIEAQFEEAVSKQRERGTRKDAPNSAR